VPAKLPIVPPVVTSENADYWRFLARRELRLQRCSGCGYVRYPPRWICPECLSEAFEWDMMTGAGTIHTFTWYMTSFDPQWTDVPYNVTVVELQEGPRLVTNIEGVEFGQLRIGQTVQALIVPLSGDVGLLRFVLS
jgi:uncharacterized OB-fold protein